ncbi:response regulator [Streptomyces sp. SL13]|uniref:Response regulator n=1 Tax=Streptantibioticus silvisoli TaxID=2705255 RepID=A0AA90HA42_9ACTN|nr:response regulator [Streptantibioticus silvisoli]MDI5973628.1 response regulator [Streptantibioticus silvisoli]
MDDTPGRVLVVDDNKVVRQLIRVNLELEGFEVVTAADGAECLEVVHRVRPDVVTLDVVMPRIDGIRAAARLRGDPRTRHLPIAIISAGGRPRETYGVDAFVGKPFEPDELVRVVRGLLLAGARSGNGSGNGNGNVKGKGNGSDTGARTGADRLTATAASPGHHPPFPLVR